MLVLGRWTFTHVGFADASVIIDGAQRILDGQVPYRDFFHFYTPGAITLLAAMLRLFGDNVTTLLLEPVLLAAAVAVGVGLLVRELGSRSWQISLAGLFAANTSAIWWPFPEHVLLASTVALFGLVAGVRAGRGGSGSSAFAAGLLSATACWFAQAQGVFALLSIALPLVLLRRQLARYVLAGVLVAAAPVTVLVALVPVGELWQDLVVFPLTRYPEIGQRAYDWLDLHPQAPRVDGWRKAAQMFEAATTLAVCVAAALVGAVSGLRRGSLPLALTGVAAVGAVGSILYRPDATHFTYVAPLLVAPGAWLISRASEASAFARSAASVLVLAHVATFLPVHEAVLAATGATRVVRTARGDMPIGTEADLGGPPGELARVVAYLQERTEPDAPLFTYPNLGLLYFLLARPNVTRFDYFYTGQDPISSYTQTVEDIEAAETRTIVSYTTPSAGPGEGLLLGELQLRYQVAFSTGSILVWERSHKASN